MTYSFFYIVAGLYFAIQNRLSYGSQITIFLKFHPLLLIVNFVGKISTANKGCFLSQQQVPTCTAE